MPRPPSFSSDLYHALDPVAFARERLAFNPDPRQASILASTSKQVILNCTRQWGKSTVTAARAVFTAWHHPESLTIVLGPSERQSSELVRKAATFLTRLGVRPRGDGSNKSSLLLPNGARIVGLPASEANTRGAEELYLAMRPILARLRLICVNPRSSAARRNRLFIMGPHAENLDDALVFDDLINQAVLNINAT